MQNHSRNQNQHFREHASENLDQEAALESIKRKIRASGIKVDTIINQCEEIDRNNDGLIHPDDLLDILRNLLTLHSLSRREKRYLRLYLSDKKHSVSLDYKRLATLLENENNHLGQKFREKWLDDDIAFRSNENTKWAIQPNSVGEWLQTAAFPIEQTNYARFMNCLEKFERESGMRIVSHPDGMLVPLGPNLRASVQIYLA